LSRLIGRALQETAPLWPDIKRAFGWVHRAAHILNNTEALPARWPGGWMACAAPCAGTARAPATWPMASTTSSK
jgi:hypothetical protein